MNTAVEDYVAQALADARANVVLSDSAPSGPAIIFDALCQMLDIDRRWKISHGPSSHRSAWPEYVHSTDEKEEAALQRMLYDGEPVNVTAPSQRELSIMGAVLSNFRAALLVGDKQNQDWEILRMLAAPRLVMRGKKNYEKQVRRSRSLREVAKEISKKYGPISHTEVANRRNLQLAAIWKKVKYLMPLSRTETAILRSLDLMVAA
jgi:hypothetical protein